MEIPKGKLIPIGGNEDKGTEPEPNYEQKNNIKDRKSTRLNSSH